MIWNLILHIPVIMAILLFTWFSVRCSYGIQLTSKIGLFSTSRSSKTNLLKPLAVLGPLVLVDQKITNITDNGSWPNQIHFWLKYQEQKLKETFSIERFFCQKRVIHIAKASSKLLHCQHRKILRTPVYLMGVSSQLLKSFEFGNGSRMSDENLVILEFKYLQNKKC